MSCFAGHTWGQQLEPRTLAAIMGETRYANGLQAQKSEFQFSLMVPEKGTVTGALQYFPFENEQETMPREEETAGTAEFIQNVDMTQQPPAATQRLTQAAAAHGADGVLLHMPPQVPECMHNGLESATYALSVRNPYRV
jgi:hypothetical protein